MPTSKVLNKKIWPHLSPIQDITVLSVVVLFIYAALSIGGFIEYKYLMAGKAEAECNRLFEQKDFKTSTIVCNKSASYWFRQSVKDKAEKSSKLHSSHLEYLAGLEAFQDTKWEEAMEFLSKVIPEDPDYPDAVDKIATAKKELALLEKDGKVAGVKDKSNNVSEQHTQKTTPQVSLKNQTPPKPVKDTKMTKRISSLENKIKSLENQQTKTSTADTPVGISLNNNEIKSIAELFCFSDDGTQISTGSGTIVDASGVIYTNRHVVQNPNGSVIQNSYTCLVGITNDISKLSQIKYWATLLIYSPSMDVAVLYIWDVCSFCTYAPSTLPSSFPFIPTGSSSTLSAGNDIWIAGYPISGDGTWTLTKGIISGKSGALFKTDAQIDNGNSGGAALNKNKELIGIPTAYIAGGGETLGYFIGIDQVNSLSDWISLY